MPTSPEDNWIISWWISNLKIKFSKKKLPKADILINLGWLRKFESAWLLLRMK